MLGNVLKGFAEFIKTDMKVTCVDAATQTKPGPITFFFLKKGRVAVVTQNLLPLYRFVKEEICRDKDAVKPFLKYVLCYKLRST